jgi:hypothetical protein
MIGGIIAVVVFLAVYLGVMIDRDFIDWWKNGNA